MPLNHRGTTAIITGASSGLGAEFARILAARGANLVLVARRAERLAELATDIRSKHGVEVHTIALDLTELGATDALVAAVRERGLSIDTVINNAGFGMRGAVVDANAARLDEQVRLNVGAVVSITRAFLPEMVASGRGALVNVASTAAFVPVPLMAVYGATKAFVLSFTEAVAFETRDSSLRVTAICPGATRTEFFDVVGTEDAAVGSFQTPPQVVATAMRCPRRPSHSGGDRVGSRESRHHRFCADHAAGNCGAADRANDGALAPRLNASPVGAGDPRPGKVVAQQRKNDVTVHRTQVVEPGQHLDGPSGGLQPSRSRTNGSAMRTVTPPHFGLYSMDIVAAREAEPRHPAGPPESRRRRNRPALRRE